jgi:hypothetical protein
VRGVGTYRSGRVWSFSRLHRCGTSIVVI